MKINSISIFLLLILFSPLTTAKPTIKVGSKVFTESYILAEIVSQILEDAGEVVVERRLGLGGTGIAFKALIEGEVDIYPEYTGTIKEAILKESTIENDERLRSTLNKLFNLEMSEPLGFNNTYIFATTKEGSQRTGIRKISDIRDRPDLKTVFSHEFMKRKDGLKGLEDFYGFKLRHPVAMEHSLAYEALVAKKVDLMEVYSTDAKIKKYELVLIDDDQKFFPRYLAVLLYKKKFQSQYPRSFEALKENLFDKIDNKTMIDLNSLVELEGKSFAQAAAIFLGKEKLHDNGIPLQRIWNLTIEHLKLVFVSLLFSILLGIPIGIIATKSPALGQISLIGSGLLQTIPSLALLCFLIPFFGIGAKPAYVAIFLYGLLPIVRNTYTGIIQIDPSLDESADLMGLSKWEKLRLIQLPLASVNILAGIKTSAIINVGTATLAAFIGAGGLGSLIVTGLALNSNKIILTGAIPAALLASALHILFELLDKIIVPKGLRH